jgi:hypothetical protein
MASHLNDPHYWRDRAEEIRVIADRLRDPEARAMMFGCVEGYELLADRAEERLKQSARLN